MNSVKESYLSDELKSTLEGLAQKYEVPSFCESDPSQFLRWYNPSVKENIPDVEVCSFIAAMLAFGNRKQFIPKIASIMELADKTSGSISKWLISGAYKESFSKSEKKFYRFYSYNDMQDFFGDLAELLGEGEPTRAGGLADGGAPTGAGETTWDGAPALAGVPADGGVPTGAGETTWDGAPTGAGETTWDGAPTLGDAIHLRFSKAVNDFNTATSEGIKKLQKPHLSDVLSAAFPNSSIVPKGKTSANKRINMFLRWMVRRNSPVDLGIWNWYSPSELLIPLDVHVMEEGIKLGVLPENAKATRKTAVALTESLKEIWPTDPCKGDFALFGLGVDTSL